MTKFQMEAMRELLQHGRYSAQVGSKCDNWLRANKIDLGLYERRCTEYYNHWYRNDTKPSDAS